MIEPLRIVIVEDEAIILMQIEMILDDAGHTVVGTAMTAREAISLIHETRPELVFIDLRLGDDSSGLEVAEAAHEAGGITAVFMTANARQLSEDLDGAVAVIAKPFTESVLEQALLYLENCVRRPPPGELIPHGLRMSGRYLASFA